MEGMKKLNVPKRYKVTVKTIDDDIWKYECDDCYWGGDPPCYFVQINDYTRIMFLTHQVKMISKIDIEAKAKSERGEL